MNSNTTERPVFPARYTPEGIYETRMIKRNAACIFAGILTWLLLRSILPNMMFSGITIVITMARISIVPSTAAVIYSSVDIISTILSMGLPFFVVMRIIDIPLKAALPFRKIRSGFNMGSLFIALALSTLGVYSGSLLASMASSLGFSPQVPAVETPTDITTGILYAITLVVIPAFLEEIVFRGIILQPLRRFGDGFAIVVSAVLFSLAHLNLYQIPNAFLIGLLMGYFVVRSGSIWPGIIIHFVNNSVAAVFEYLMDYIPMQTLNIMNLSVYVFYLAAGLLSLIILSRKQKKLFMLIPYNGILSTKERLRCYFTCAPTIILILVLLVLSLSYML